MSLHTRSRRLGSLHESAPKGKTHHALRAEPGRFYVGLTATFTHVRFNLGVALLAGHARTLGLLRPLLRYLSQGTPTIESITYRVHRDLCMTTWGK